MTKRLPFEKLHGDEGAAFEIADIVDGADIGVIECGGSARLAAETFDGLGVVSHAFREKFKGDIAAEARTNRARAAVRRSG